MGFARADVGALAVGVLGWAVVFAVWDWWNSDHCLWLDSVGILYDLMGGFGGLYACFDIGHWKVE